MSMNKLIPLAKPIRPSCIWNLEDLASVEVIDLDKKDLRWFMDLSDQRTKKRVDAG